MASGTTRARFHRDDLTPQVAPWRGPKPPAVRIADLDKVEAAVAEERRLQTAIGDDPVPCAADPDAHFPTTRAGVDAAEAACLDCPAFVACDLYARALGVEHGVWGGRWRGSRRDLRKESSA